MTAGSTKTHDGSFRFKREYPDDKRLKNRGEKDSTRTAIIIRVLATGEFARSLGSERGEGSEGEERDGSGNDKVLGGPWHD